MRRIIITVSILVALVACSFLFPKPPIVIPGVIVIEAQTLPITKNLAWDQPDEIINSVTSWTVRLDTIVIGSPTTKIQPFTITTLGPHVLTVVANNIWTSSAPTTLNINVVAPSAPTGARIQ